MSYRIAGIDVHKKMLAVVVSNVEVESEFQFERRMFGGNPEQLRLLAAWLLEQEAEEVVMESTAQYWKPVWGALERYWKPIRETHIKLSSLVSDLLGVSARRMLNALADGETNPAALAALAHQRLRATPEQLCDALGACTELKPVYRRLLKMTLEHLQILEQQIGQLDQELATLLHPHQDAVQRLAEVPGLGVDSAQQIIAEVGPTVAIFPSAKQLSSWVGASPGDEESAGVNYSHRSPKGNRQMRRILNQSANAAVKAKGTVFEVVYRRTVPRLGHQQTIGAVAHRQCRLIWKILHQGVRYEERGSAVHTKSKQRRAARMRT